MLIEGGKSSIKISVRRDFHSQEDGVDMFFLIPPAIGGIKIIQTNIRRLKDKRR